MSKKSNSNLLAVIRQLALENIQIKTHSPWLRCDRAYLDPRNAELVELRLQAAIEKVSNTSLMAFLESVFAEPEVRQILIQPVIRKGQFKGIRLDPLQSMAEGVQQSCSFGGSEREVVYVATLLHGIEHWLIPGLHPGSSVEDVMFTIVRSALHRLEDAQPAHAGLLRLCMGWANADEESEFAQALMQRIQRAVETLDLAQF